MSITDFQKLYVQDLEDAIKQLCDIVGINHNTPYKADTLIKRIRELQEFYDNNQTVNIEVEDVDILRKNSERYRKIRFSKTYRIDLYEEALDDWLDLQPVYYTVSGDILSNLDEWRLNSNRYLKVRNSEKNRVDLYEAELDEFLDLQ